MKVYPLVHPRLKANEPLYELLKAVHVRTGHTWERLIRTCVLDLIPSSLPAYAQASRISVKRKVDNRSAFSRDDDPLRMYLHAEARRRRCSIALLVEEACVAWVNRHVAGVSAACGDAWLDGEERVKDLRSVFSDLGASFDPALYDAPTYEHMSDAEFVRAWLAHKAAAGQPLYETFGLAAPGAAPSAPKSIAQARPDLFGDN
jgi:hypothetical protein